MSAVIDCLGPPPGPPDFTVDWPAIEAACPWLAALGDCPQDPAHHAEGDVLVHTRMVVESLAALSAYRALSAADRSVAFAASLLHDIAKPQCTHTGDDGRIHSPGHSRRGEIAARALLYRAGAPPHLREQAAAIIRFHQVPFFLIDRADAKRVGYRVSQSARCDLLALVAESDGRGRVCADQEHIVSQVELFREWCRVEECLDRPRAFPSDHSRFLYFRKEDRSPDYLAHDDTRMEVTVLSGLPGAGKDSWIRRHQPDARVLSLDAIRESMNIDPTDPQGPVIAAAEERAREHLRAGHSFILNATSLTRDLRGQWINLFAAYNSRVRIVTVEVPYRALHARNRERAARVPEAVIERLIDKWEMPDAGEAHAVLHHASEGD